MTSSGFIYDLEREPGRLDFRLVSRDLGPLGPVLQAGPAPGRSPPSGCPPRAAARPRATVTFAREDYTLQIILDLQDAVAPVTAADTVRGSLTLNPRALEDLRIELTRGGGALLVTGRVPLPPEGNAWPPEPFDLAVDAAQWPAAGARLFLGPELAEAFTGASSPAGSTSAASPTA